MKSLIVIPTYNERDSLPELEIALRETDCDLLFVDDNSPDGTADLIADWQKRRANVYLLKRAVKGGLAGAYLAGFAWGLERGYEAIVQMDADLSHHPSYLKSLFNGLFDHHLVIGSRYVAGGGVENWSFLRRLISRGGSLYARLWLGLKIKDLTGGFNAWRSEALKKLDLSTVKSEGYSFQIEMKQRAAAVGLNILETPIIFKERRSGKSKMSKKIFWEAFWRVPLMRFKPRPTNQAAPVNNS